MTTDNVIYLNGTTTLDLPVDRVLNGAMHLKSVAIIGIDQDDQPYYAFSMADRDKINYLLDVLKLEILGVAFNDE